MKFRFTFQAATQVSLRVYIKNKWNICSGLLLHVSLSQKISHHQPWVLRVENIPPDSRTLVRAPKPCRHTLGDGAGDFPKRNPGAEGMNCQDSGMDLGQNLRSTHLWISPGFCICVTAWICLFLPFDTFWKTTKLLNSHWRALAEAGMLFPGKKKKFYRKETLQPNIHIPGCIYPKALWWERIYL